MSQLEKEGKGYQSTGSPGDGTLGRGMEKRESGVHTTGLGKVNQQRAEGEVLG